MTNQISVERLSPILHAGIPVITTELLSQLYGTEVINIHVNFTRNKTRFVEGKHFFRLEGADLKVFKNNLTESKLVASRAKHLILWTERGAARHAKLLETDQAWEVFERLEDCYFNRTTAVTPPDLPQRFIVSMAGGEWKAQPIGNDEMVCNVSTLQSWIENRQHLDRRAVSELLLSCARRLSELK
ncbi:ORF6N domain-containing protein [Klebsiella oxytoca]|nr:ORF6N domain-containing protein [Klebsiella oxytoca]